MRPWDVDHPCLIASPGKAWRGATAHRRLTWTPTAVNHQQVWSMVLQQSMCVCVWTVSKDVKPVPWVFWNFLQSGFNFNTSLQQGARNPWFVCPGQRRPDDMGVKTYLLFELLSKLSHCFVFSIHHLSTWWVFNSFPNLENHRERWQLNIYIYIYSIEDQLLQCSLIISIFDAGDLFGRLPQRFGHWFILLYSSSL